MKKHTKVDFRSKVRINLPLKVAGISTSAGTSAGVSNNSMAINHGAGQQRTQAFVGKLRRHLTIPICLAITIVHD